MKEFVEKLIGRLEEESDYEPIDYDYCDMCCSDEEHFISTHKAKEIVNQLAEEYNNDIVNQLAMKYAICLTKFGVDITEKLETATQNAMALEQAYIRGRQDERDRFAKWQDEYNNGWISCSERLPEKYGEYLCCNEYGEFILGYPVAKHSDDGFYVETDTEGLDYVIAWQPLPQPYKENENGNI